MNLLNRLSFFLFGCSIGIILIFIFFGKRSFFEGYFPNKRVLNSIKKKEIVFDFKKEELSFDLQLFYDKNFIKNDLVKKAQVLFSKSNIREKKFPIYLILYKDPTNKKEIFFTIENQSSKAIIKNINKNH